MNKILKYKKYIIPLIIILISSLIIFFNIKNLSQKNDKELEKKAKENLYTEEVIKIEPECTYGELMTQADICSATSTVIFEAAKDLYDLSKIRVGREIKLMRDKNTNELKELVYQVDTEEELKVALQADGSWRAEKKPIDYIVKIKTSEGTIESSLYETGLNLNIDEVAIISLADVFQWTIDFAMNIQKGDSFKFIYEERYLNDKYIMPGKILAAKFINSGKKYSGYYFRDATGIEGYYDENGNSLQKIFLKAPVSYKYISSPFTTGSRYVEAFNVATKHRAIDYAAPYGTPIKAVGDGTVVVASRNGAYGNFVSIRHNSTYTTHYGHLSKFAVKAGNKVTQGQTIGYVGSTGFSTGPHVHYEMLKNGALINPQSEDFPNTQSIKNEDKQSFQKIVDDYKNKL